MGLELFWASDGTPTQGAARWVLKQLGTMAKDATGWCWASIGSLARMVAVSERQVQRVLKRLEQLGLVEVRRGNGAGRVSRFRVVLEPSRKRVTAPCEQPVDAAAERVTPCPEKGDMVSPGKGSEKKEEKVVPKTAVDKSRPWASGFSLRSAFFGTSSFASFGWGSPSRPGGSPLPGSPPCTPPARSTTASGSSCSGMPPELPSAAELVAEFIAERRAQPRW